MTPGLHRTSTAVPGASTTCTDNQKDKDRFRNYTFGEATYLLGSPTDKWGRAAWTTNDV